MSHIQLVKNKNGHCRLCTEIDQKSNMVACDESDRWFHQDCVNLDQLPTKSQRWICPKCTELEAERQKSEAEKQKLKAEIKALREPVSVSQFKRMFTQLNVKQDPDQDCMKILMKRQAMVSLPRFNGLAKEWPRFKKAFDSTTAEGQFSNIENLNRFQQALDGNALKAVSHFMYEVDNVPRILERLEECVGRSSQVSDEFLKNLTRIHGDPKESVVEISDALDALVTHIEAMGRPEYLQVDRRISKKDAF